MGVSFKSRTLGDDYFATLAGDPDKGLAIAERATFGIKLGNFPAGKGPEARVATTLSNGKALSAPTAEEEAAGVTAFYFRYF